jgi:hypothetical protein
MGLKTNWRIVRRGWRSPQRDHPVKTFVLDRAHEALGVTLATDGDADSDPTRTEHYEGFK